MIVAVRIDKCGGFDHVDGLWVWRRVETLRSSGSFQSSCEVGAASVGGHRQRGATRSRGRQVLRSCVTWLSGKLVTPKMCSRLLKDKLFFLVGGKFLESHSMHSLK